MFCVISGWHFVEYLDDVVGEYLVGCVFVGYLVGVVVEYLCGGVAV